MSPLPAAVHQMLPNLAYGDAIGNEVLSIQRHLRELGCRSEIFAGVIHPRLVDRAFEYDQYPEHSSPDNVLIYHFSVGSELAEMVTELPDRLVVLHHNITPPRWFQGVSPHMVELSVLGERQLADMAGSAAAAWADSAFNAEQMRALGYPEPHVLPIVTTFEAFDQPGCPVTRRVWRRPGVKTILFVGRISPNKRHENLIRAFAAHRRWGSAPARLICVGDYDNCRRYYDSLRDLIQRLRVPDVHFTGMVPFDELVSYYRMADLLLCLSEHEGFCVPLLEAFHLDIPVAALAATAVPETMDGAGVLLRTTDPVLVAELMDRLLQDPELRRTILEGQRARMERYSRLDLAGRLRELLEAVP